MYSCNDLVTFSEPDHMITPHILRAYHDVYVYRATCNAKYVLRIISVSAHSTSTAKQYSAAIKRAFELLFRNVQFSAYTGHVLPWYLVRNSTRTGRCAYHANDECVEVAECRQAGSSSCGLSNAPFHKPPRHPWWVAWFSGAYVPLYKPLNYDSLVSELFRSFCLVCFFSDSFCFLCI